MKMKLTDEKLISRLKLAVETERECLGYVLESLVEVIRRELHLAYGYSSLVTFCEKELGLSRSSSLKRVLVAKMILKFPAILQMLRRGGDSSFCSVSVE